MTPRHPGRRDSGDGPGPNEFRFRNGYGASGTGPKTLDGCSVEVYRRLPYLGEIDLLKAWMPMGSTVLELGCGVGRVTRPLLAAGYHVTAVDNSADMLAYAPNEATKILSNIEALDLDQEFDAVILGSCLVNTPDAALRARQLGKCRRHVRDGGVLLLERHDCDWLASVKPGPTGRIGEIELSVLEARHRGPEVDLCVRYESDGEVWLQRFTAQVLDDDAVEQALATAGFGPAEWINRRWAACRASGAD